MLRLLQLLVWALVCRPASSWISISQARYGADLENLRSATYMQSSSNADRSLGWLWSAPRSPTDTRGLGQSITWAWDGTLCDKLLPAFRSDAFGVPLIDCGTIKATMHRAFSTWSQNHPAISFTEVTDLCLQAGQLNEDCPHAEIWVTFRNQSRDGSTGGVAGAVQAAVALPQHRISNDFVYTNGERPMLTVTGSGSPRQIPKQFIEVDSGRIEFAYEDPICWYVDSNFCNYFHVLKAKFSDPNVAHAVGAIILFVLWGFAAICMIVEIIYAFLAQMKKKAKVFIDRDGDGEVEAHEIAVQAIENAYLRLQAFLSAIAAESIMGTAVRFTLLMIPWPFYIAVFQVCWDCYDFEAAASHEIGHMLGIAHPDKAVGAELAPGYQPTNSSFYNAYLASGNSMNASHCAHPWDDVLPGVPPSFPTSELTGSFGPLVRPSIMESFTTHNPSVCLFQDDYEALVTLYPVCASVPPTPRCEKADRNLGLLRVTIFVIGPLLVALIFSIFLHIFVEYEKKHIDKKKAAARREPTLKELNKSAKKHQVEISRTPVTPIDKEDLGVGSQTAFAMERPKLTL